MRNKLENLKEKKGFTIIEVVIVLAIAALIILIVLLAVGALQRSQRDNSRKNYAGRMIAGLQQYTSNNNGVVPVAAIPASYFGTAPTGFTTGYGTGTPPTATNRNFFGYISTGICTANLVASGPAGTPADQFAVDYWSETGNVSVCITN